MSRFQKFVQRHRQIKKNFYLRETNFAEKKLQHNTQQELKNKTNNKKNSNTL